MADTVDNLKQNFEDFLNFTQEERTRAETRRDYRDLKQWTDEQVEVLRERKQAAIVFDQFGKKIDAITGLEVQRRSDPRAYPVLPEYEQASSAITDALRYIEKNTAFDEVASEVFEEKIVEGYGGVIIEAMEKGKKKEHVISIKQVYWDRCYYDPRSRMKNFKDSKYFGISIWMDVVDVKERWPKTAENIDGLMDRSGFDGTTFDDRPSTWIDSNRNRVRVNQEYILDNKVWKEVFYTGDLILREMKDSPYLDCEGDPMCPIELQSDFIDRDNNRYAYSQRLIDVQDEINHRRSKALHMLSSKSVTMERGATGEVTRQEILDELKKPESVIEIIPGTTFQVDNQQDMGASQLGFYQDAQQAMDSVGINPELAGRTEGAISGRAFLARQQGGMIELTRIFARHSEWKQRVYQQMWARVKQFWTKEKWVRVTDEDDAMKFVGLNIPIAKAEKLIEQQSGKDINELKKEFGPELEQLLGQMVQNDPTMEEVVETRNNVVELNMDIILEEAPDTVALQQEQFDTLAQLASARADPEMFKALLKLSTLSKKDEVMDMLEGDKSQQEAAAQAQQQALQLQTAQIQADLQKTASETAKNAADVQLKEAQAKDEIASAMERVGKVSAIGLPNQ